MNFLAMPLGVVPQSVTILDRHKRFHEKTNNNRSVGDLGVDPPHGDSRLAVVNMESGRFALGLLWVAGGLGLVFGFYCSGS